MRTAHLKDAKSESAGIQEKTTSAAIIQSLTRLSSTTKRGAGYPATETADGWRRD